MRTGFGSFFTSRRSSWMAGLAVAAMMTASMGMRAQDAAPAAAQAPAATTAPAATADATVSNAPAKKHKRIAKEDQVKQTKDTKAAEKEQAKLNPFVGKDANLPDKALYDKALAQANSGHYDVARLDLQTLLNTYSDSPYQMRAKLAVADCWYHEGGTAALAQAEQEYTDFITFFPNAPEAAEAQMRVGDIYFKQMDVPDRDYTKATKAEDAYRTMLKQYPDAPAVLLKEGRQKLREVQEVMATREADLGAFYASHENWAASIARFETVVNTYPQYSHMDDALIGVGDGYEAEVKVIKTQNLPEGAKAALLQEYDGKAAAAYRKVVLEHAAAPHVEDAKERLAEMNLPIPTPTAEQVAASEALEGSRAQYTMAKRLELLVLRRPDTVVAATAGDPPLEDPPVRTAPAVVSEIRQSYVDAFDPKGAAARAAAKATSSDTAEPGANPQADMPVAAAPLAFQDVAAPGAGGGDASTVTEAPAASGGGTGIGGVEIVTPKATTGPASTAPSATGSQDPNNGLSAVGPKDAAPLPAAEAAAPAPDQVNDLNGVQQPAVAPGTKDAYDKKDESSSKHQPKQGVDKLNPF
jgi:outer membrane protein assembly factor BamD